jgi:hypothetical protein
MRVSEAKDFLIQQTAEQALREGVSLSELEKRMMYFTESEDAVENPIALNEEFEAHYATDEYESKIARLLIHAYRRLKKENPYAAQLWDAAIAELRKGDHYILVMWSQRSSVERPRHDFLRLLGYSFLVVVVGVGAMVGAQALSDHFHWHWNSVPQTRSSQPAWAKWLFWGLAGDYVVVPAVVKRPVPGLGQLLIWILRVKPKQER